MANGLQEKPSLRAWLIWACGSLFVLYQFLLQSSTSVMIPCLQAAFDINVIHVGFLTSSYFYTYLLLQIPAGILVDRWGARRVILGGIVLCAAGCLLFALTDQLTVAHASRMIMGLAGAPAVAGTLALAARWFPPARFALVAGLMETLGMLGGAIGEEVLSICVDSSLGWRGTMVASSLMGFFIAILAFIIVRDYPKGKGPKATEKTAPVWQGICAVVCQPQAWICGFYSGLMFALIAGFAGLWAIPYIELYYHASLLKASTASAMIFLGAAGGAPFWGWLSESWRRRPAMFLGTGLTLVTALLIVYLPGISYGLMLVLMLALGFCAGTYILPFAVMRQLIPLQFQGTAMGYTNMMSILIGAPVLQPLIGWLLTLSWQGDMHAGKIVYQLADYRFALGVIPASLALALLLVVFVKEKSAIAREAQKLRC